MVYIPLLRISIRIILFEIVGTIRELLNMFNGDVIATFEFSEYSILNIYDLVGNRCLIPK